jgi:hypothetical protein
MKIKYKKNGNFEVEFNEYFKTVDELKSFIKESNKFINVDILTDKINEIYFNLSNLDGSIKSSVLDWLIIKEFNFKFKRPNNLNFWLERGFGINEFNKNVGSKIKDLDVNVENTFKFNNYTFNMFGKPCCNLCGDDLLVKPTIGRYEISGCGNINCASHKNVSINTIKQLAFLPIEFFKNKNKRINIESKLTKEYWLLKGLSYNDTLIKIQKCKDQLINVSINTFNYYKFTTDMSDDLINIKIKEQSKMCVEYWLKKGVTEEDAIKNVKNFQKNNSLKGVEARVKNPEKYISVTETQIGYWLKKGYNEEEASKKLSERQSTFSLKKCIEKYGEEYGLIKFKERQHKWLKNYKKNNFSKISQELFWGMLEKEPNLVDRNIYFATYKNGVKDDSGKNNEYRLELLDSIILPDFFDKISNKIIEFDGTYYHRKTPENLLREEKRDKMIFNSNYKIYHVSETDYKNDKQGIIIKCINFLKYE